MSRKKWIFYLKRRSCVNSEGYFCLRPRQKNVKYSDWSGVLVDVEDVSFWKVVNTLSRVIGLVSFVLHYNASNLVLEILKHDKILGTICIGVSHSKFWWTRTPVPVIYVHDDELTVWWETWHVWRVDQWLVDCVVAISDVCMKNIEKMMSVLLMLVMLGVIIESSQALTCFYCEPCGDDPSTWGTCTGEVCVKGVEYAGAFVTHNFIKAIIKYTRPRWTHENEAAWQIL